MSWKIVGGRPVKATVEMIHTPPEVTVVTEIEGVYVCGFCAKAYKTEGGLDRHQADKH